MKVLVGHHVVCGEEYAIYTCSLHPDVRFSEVEAGCPSCIEEAEAILQKEAMEEAEAALRADIEDKNRLDALLLIIKKKYDRRKELTHLLNSVERVFFEPDEIFAMEEELRALTPPDVDDDIPF